MRARRVMIEVEVDSAVPTGRLRQAKSLTLWRQMAGATKHLDAIEDVTIRQIQVNVIGRPMPKID